MRLLRDLKHSFKNVTVLKQFEGFYEHKKSVTRGVDSLRGQTDFWS